VRVYLTPGDDRLTVKVTGDRRAGGNIVLTGHRSNAPCGGFLYDALRLSATGQPVVVRR